MVAATRSMVLVSNDSGATWQKASLRRMWSASASAIASNSQIMIASAKARITARTARDLGAVVDGCRQGHHLVSFDATHKRLLAPATRPE